MEEQSIAQQDQVPDFDVVIVGGGVVGLTLAICLHQLDLRIALVAEQVPYAEYAVEQLVSVLSLNRASEHLLQRLGVWQQLCIQHIAPYHQITLWEHDTFHQIDFTASQVNQPYLGHIVHHHILWQALWQQVASASRIVVIKEKRPQAIFWEAQRVRLQIDQHTLLRTALIVGADGASSWVRTQASIPLTFWDYPHVALTARVKTERPHGQCARQLFYPDGVLAFLPLYTPDHCAIVWSLPPQEAVRLKKIGTLPFSHILSALFDRHLGDCQLLSDRHISSLRARYAHRFIAPRTILIGDAVHTFHPLAGQGMNLGLADVAAMGRVLQRLLHRSQPLDDAAEWCAFERQRKYEAAKYLVMVEGLQQLFAGQQPVKRCLRGIGLQAVDLCAPLKRWFIAQGCGLDSTEYTVDLDMEQAGYGE